MPQTKKYLLFCLMKEEMFVLLKAFTTCLHTKIRVIKVSFLWVFQRKGFGSSPFFCINDKSGKYIKRLYLPHFLYLFFKHGNQFCGGTGPKRQRSLQGTGFDKNFPRQTSHLSLRRSISATCVKLTASVPRPYDFDDLQGF